MTPHGRLTFEFLDTDPFESVQLLDEQPGIAAFWDVLSMEHGGQIFVKQFPDRLVVTWFQLTDRHTADFSTFQATLFIGGRVVWLMATWQPMGDSWVCLPAVLLLNRTGFQFRGTL